MADQRFQEIGRADGNVMLMDMLTGQIVSQPIEQMSAYVPTVAERWRAGLADALTGVMGADQYNARAMSERLLGRPFARPESDAATNLLDMLGVAGVTGLSAVPRGVQAYENAQAGDYGSAAGEAALAVLEGAPLVSPILRGAKAAAPAVERGLMDFIADESGSVPVPGFRPPPASNAQKTQIAGTFPTYQKAVGILDTVAPEGRAIDFGAGLGMSRTLGFDTFEPFPREGFIPTYRSAADIPDAAYDRLTNLNVLNVVPRDVRDSIVEDIGRVLRPGGAGVITTRGRDVLTAKGMPGPEPMSVITSADTYQKGFTQAELQDYLRYVLGDQYNVSPLRLGPAGALIKRNR